MNNKYALRTTHVTQNKDQITAKLQMTNTPGLKIQNRLEQYNKYLIRNESID